MTQIERARSGEITPEIENIADNEGINKEALRTFVQKAKSLYLLIKIERKR